jgi:NADH-quinone oxidoreductase subunit G
MSAQNTIDYTAQLPKEKGFKAVEFDALENFYGALGEDNRGYRLVTMDVVTEGEFEEIDDLPEFNGTVVYYSNPVNQFNAYTARTTQLEGDSSLRGSAQFATAARISNGDNVMIEGNETVRAFVLDETLKGTIALLPAYDGLFGGANESYRFEKIKLTKVGS